MEEMYTVHEVMEILKVSESTVRRWLSQGKMDFVKIMGNTRITKGELERLIIKSDKELEKHETKD